MAGSSPVRLLVVGTVHLDPLGEEKLGPLLEEVRPACVTVEVSRWGLLFRSRQAPALLSQLADLLKRRGQPDNDAVRAIQAQLALPFEYRTACHHAARPGKPVRVIPIDSSSVSHGKLRDLLELFDESNLAQLCEDTEFSLSRSVIEQQLLARRYRHDSHLFPYHFGRAEKEELAERGHRMAAALQGQLARVAPGTVVHVGGWHHLVEAEEGGLQTLANILNQKRIPWRGMLLGDQLPAPWHAPEQAERT